MFIDSHCHLNFAAFADAWREVADRAVEAGVKKMVVVGTDVATSRRAVELSEQHSALYAAVGIHPHHSKKYLNSKSQILNKSKILNNQIQNDLNEIRKLAGHDKVVAIGEIGLDKHEYKNSKYGIGEDFEIQKQLLRKQVKLAKEIGKPVILHSRDLHDEVLDEVKDMGVQGVFHCFEGSKKYLKRILAAGFYVSFTGNITFVPERADVAVGVPLERLLIETDSPFMTPAPFRGSVNEPRYVRLIAEKHATMRALPLDEVAKQTTYNAQELFRL